MKKNKNYIIHEKKINAILVEEVGGDIQHENYGNGNKRIPPKHYGKNSSIVIVFKNELETEYFDDIFNKIFNIKICKLNIGCEEFIFCAKRGSFIPFCSILNNIINYNDIKCKLCFEKKIFK